MHPRFIAVPLLACVLALVAACTPSRPAAEHLPVGSSVHAVTVDGHDRAFRLYRPAGLPDPAPLVVMLHGAVGTAEQAERSYGWNAQADRGRFLVAYPEGVKRTWAVGAGCCGPAGRTGVDDVAFVTRMVAEIGRRVPVDPSRVYATGMSNGGMLAYRLACDTRLFAAYAPVAATMLGPCPAPPPASVVHVHGTDDRTVRYDGRRGKSPGDIDGPSVPDLFARWSKTGGCGPARATTAGRVTTETAPCPSGRAVRLVTVRGAGHQWPGGKETPVAQRVLDLDPPSRALDATTEIWSFFAAHPGRR